MPYLYLSFAILFEVAATSLLKLSQGFSKMLFGILALVFYGLCFFFLSLSLKGIQLNLAYAIWAGIGLVGTTVLSIFLFREKVTATSLIGIALVISGLVLLNLSQKIH
ncbi:DMT family transporter [Streptococcus panodentis]|uniref:QacE family quaternary ammonium compound efflux SMR transporter n=1 Tax=Streptococcus panodentis TaxID=1581472 RepID=A0ABS5AY79_9STRE|nr:multidrug efflux SMR transporter [Streptococcus panodentis]MBP2621485.1 QacE family quaternary ammonium compound efflux SMR transporter [Streptococcus panodentis]